MDETAFPILLVDLALRERALHPEDLVRFWPMVRRAAGYVARNGPVTQQDRWEEDPGYSPFTLAVEIAALLTAADLADVAGEPRAAAYLRETADLWNASVERWIYASGTEFARLAGVEGHYVRIAPDAVECGAPEPALVIVKNRPSGANLEPSAHLVSTDFLALVRFGLRSPRDPRVLQTLKVIDALLRLDTPVGPAWHRYNGDGYGEHDDAAPFDGTGIGRAWPLLTGERAHYELAAGNRAGALELLRALGGFANEGGFLPEQVWDAPDQPERGLFLGRPTGSAMPLAWAHAEYVKLLRSLRDGKVFDTPPQPVARYARARTTTNLHEWRFNHRCRALPAGRTLRVEVLAPAIVRWSADGWRTARDEATRDTGLGVHVADLPTGALPHGCAVTFTFRWPQVDRWEGTDFFVTVDGRREEP
jgi:glucoamylase